MGTLVAGWRTAIDAAVVGATRDTETGISVFVARDLVSWLVVSGRCSSRTEASLLCEVLRARDVIRPTSGESRFEDGPGRWKCRAGEAPSSATMFSVAALLNAPGNYVMGGAFLKQGAVFLNPRYFVLDCTTSRLYVFTSHAGTSPRYYLDFVDKPGCTVTLHAPAGAVSALRSRREDRRLMRLRHAERLRAVASSATAAASSASPVRGFRAATAASIAGSVSSRLPSSNNSIAGSDDGGPAGSGETGSDSAAPWGSGASMADSHQPALEDDADSDSDTDDEHWFAGDSAAGAGDDDRDDLSSNAAQSLRDPLKRSARLPTGANTKLFGFTISGPDGLRITAYAPCLRRAYVWWRELTSAANGRQPKHLLSHTQQQLRRVEVVPPKAAVTSASAALASSALLNSTRSPPISHRSPYKASFQRAVSAFEPSESMGGQTSGPLSAFPGLSASSEGLLLGPAADAFPMSFRRSSIGDGASAGIALQTVAAFDSPVRRRRLDFPIGPPLADAESANTPLSADGEDWRTPMRAIESASPLRPIILAAQDSLYAASESASFSTKPSQANGDAAVAGSVLATAATVESGNAGGSGAGLSGGIRDIASLRMARFLRETASLASAPFSSPGKSAPTWTTSSSSLDLPAVLSLPTSSDGALSSPTRGLAALRAAAAATLMPPRSVDQSASIGGDDDDARTIGPAGDDDEDEDGGEFPVPSSVEELLSVPHALLERLLSPSDTEIPTRARPTAPGPPPSALACGPLPFAAAMFGAHKSALGGSASLADSAGHPFSSNAAPSTGASLVPASNSILFEPSAVAPASSPPEPQLMADLYAAPMQVLLQASGGGDVRSLRVLAVEPRRLLTDLGIVVPSHQQFILDRCFALLPPLPSENEDAQLLEEVSNDNDGDSPLMRAARAAEAAQSSMDGRIQLPPRLLSVHSEQQQVQTDSDEARHTFEANRALFQLAIASAFQSYQDSLDDEEGQAEERLAEAQAQFLSTAAAAAASGSIDEIAGRLSEGASVSFGLKGTTVSSGAAGVFGGGVGAQHRDLCAVSSEVAREWALELAKTAMTVHAAFRPARRAARLAAAKQASASRPPSFSSPLKAPPLPSSTSPGDSLQGSGAPGTMQGTKPRGKSFLSFFFAPSPSSSSSSGPSSIGSPAPGGAATLASPQRALTRDLPETGRQGRSFSGATVDLEQTLQWWNGAEKVRRAAAATHMPGSRRSSEDGDYSYGVSDDDDEDMDGEYGDDDDGSDYSEGDGAGSEYYDSDEGELSPTGAGARGGAAAPSPSALPAVALILSQSMDLVLGRLKALFARHYVRLLLEGDSPLSHMLQQLVCNLQALYGPATLPYFGLDPREALERFREDSAPLLARAISLMRDAPRAWLGALADWGATGMYVSPPEDFAATVREWDDAFRGHATGKQLGGGAGESGAFPPGASLTAAAATAATAGHAPLLGRWLEGADVFGPPAPQTSARSPPLSAVASPAYGSSSSSSSSSAAFTPGRPPRHSKGGRGAYDPETPSSSSSARPHSAVSPQSSRCAAGGGARLSAAWRYVCGLARSLTLSDREVEAVCAEAVQRVVFGALGPSVLGLYRRVHGEDDARLRSAYSALWGLTTTQLELAPELRVDAVGPHVPVPQPHGIVGLYTSSALPLGLPLPPLAVVTAATAALERASRLAAHYLPGPLSPGSASSATKPFLSPAPLSPWMSGGDGATRGRSVSMLHNATAALVGLDSIPEDVADVTGIEDADGNQQRTASGAASPAAVPPAWPIYARGSFARPASLASIQPAVDIFALLPHFADPIAKMRVLLAVVDVLCRSVTLHRQGLAAALAACGQGDAHAASLVEPSQINADDLLGSLAWVAVHAGVPHLFAEIEFICDHVPPDMMMERGGFVLTTLQAAVMYAKGQDPRDRLRCGHCEAPGKPLAARCKPCGRVLCSECDALVHGAGSGEAAFHPRAPIGLPVLSPAQRALSPSLAPATASTLIALSPLAAPASPALGGADRQRSRTFSQGHGLHKAGSARSLALPAAGALTPQVAPVVRVTWLAERRTAAQTPGRHAPLSSSAAGLPRPFRGSTSYVAPGAPSGIAAKALDLVLQSPRVSQRYRSFAEEMAREGRRSMVLLSRESGGGGEGDVDGDGRSHTGVAEDGDGDGPADDLAQALDDVLRDWEPQA